MNSKIKKLVVNLNETHRNTKSKSKALGKVELKYISLGDERFFTDLLKRVEDNKEFVARLLYHQLVIQKLDFAEFNKISDEELRKLARDFIWKEQYAFKYFKETTAKEFFNNFREAIEKYHQKQAEQLQAAFQPAIKSIKKMYESFNKRFAAIINQPIKLPPYIPELVKEFSKVGQRLAESQLLIAESLRPVIEQCQLNARILYEALMPQINVWQEWAEKNRSLFDGFTKFWQKFQKQYEISEEEAIQVLRKYKWFITPSLPLNFVFKVVKIGRRPSNQRKAINRFFVNYFTPNNYANLKDLVEGWKTNTIFKPRMKIFRDCVLVMENANGKHNPSNLVLPTLIAQIDGIRFQFMDKHGVSFWSKAWKKLFRDQTTNQNLLDLANDIFLNILFQESQPGIPLEKPFTFNRHKIMHGEYLGYGRIDNTIRAFLILDFLASIK